LGSKLYVSDPFQLYSKSTGALFSTLLPQLSTLYPSVNAAVAAFGAAYDSAVLRAGDSLAEDYSTKQYGIALRLLQHELGRSEPQYAPLLVASTLLASAETIQARQKGALAHVLGAFGIFTNRHNRQQLLPSNVEPVHASGDGGLSAENISLLENLCTTLDTQVATFAWGERPHLSAQPFTQSITGPQNVDELCQELPKLIHIGLHFVAAASEDSLQLKADLSFDLIMKQSQILSWLRKWLDSFSELVETNDNSYGPKTPYGRHLRLLKAQCLAMLLGVSNIRTTLQTSWDKYGPEFEEIVNCAAIVLEGADFPATSTSSIPSFSPAPGVIQPLFFTARKYRHSLVRRRAISLLRLTGYEGPFSGDFEADLATRFVEIEEARPFSMQLSEEEVLLPSNIPDWGRICSCWRLSDKFMGDDRMVKFCRRKKSSYRNLNQNPVISGDDYFSSSLSDSPPQTDESDNYEVWSELVHSYKLGPHPQASGYDASSNLGVLGSVIVPAHPTAREPWVPDAGESKSMPVRCQSNSMFSQPVQNTRLSRDPDWVKTAVASGEIWNFWDGEEGQVPGER
jgi:hypothetical protein